MTLGKSFILTNKNLENALLSFDYLRINIGAMKENVCRARTVSMVKY